MKTPQFVAAGEAATRAALPKIKEALTAEGWESRRTRREFAPSTPCSWPCALTWELPRLLTIFAAPRPAVQRAEPLST